MAPISKYFKTSASTNYKTPPYVNEKIRKWMEDYNSKVHQDLIHIEEEEQDDEIDWDDTGRSVCSSSSFNINRNKTANNMRANAKLSSASTNKERVTNTPTNNYFLRPKTPCMSQPKIFTPIIVSSESGISSYSRESCNSNNYLGQAIYPSRSQVMSLDNSFDSQSSMLNNTFENANKSFQIIDSQLQELNSVANSLNNSFRCRCLTPPISVSQETQTDMDQSTLSKVLPGRSYDENSVDLKLAFLDKTKFIALIRNENSNFNDDSNVEEFLSSQLVASEADLNIKVVSQPDYSINKDVPPYVQRLQKGLNKIFEPRHTYDSQESYRRTSPNAVNSMVLHNIQKFFAELNEDIVTKKPVTVKVLLMNWKNVKYQNGILVAKELSECKISKLTSRTNIVLYLMRKIYGLLMLNTQFTKRSIYYQLKSLLPNQKISQAQVDTAINIVSCYLKVSPWNLNILSTSKGLVYGDLTLVIGDTHIACNSQNGTVIPTDLNNLKEVHSNAYFILIVEKDTVFQKLMIDDLPNKMSRKFILITGKGYADMLTRRLLNILWKLLAIPMFIVVDADPYGIDIFLSYKFGSMSMAYLSPELALPKAKWLGILPSEIQKYNTKSMDLTTKDTKKLNGILQRSYFARKQNKGIAEEIKILIRNKRKCEIEGIFKTNMFFSNVYLPAKLYEGNFI